MFEITRNFAAQTLGISLGIIGTVLGVVNTILIIIRYFARQAEKTEQIKSQMEIQALRIEIEHLKNEKKND